MGHPGDRSLASIVRQPGRDEDRMSAIDLVIDLHRRPTAADLEIIEGKAAGRRVIHPIGTCGQPRDLGRYLIMSSTPPRSCGACGEAVPVGRVCGCQAKPKMGVTEHVTERCTAEVLKRLGLTPRTP